MHWTYTSGTRPGIGIVVLLLISSLFGFTPSLRALPSSSPAEASGAKVRIENLTKLPGTNRGFPAENYFTFQHSDRLQNSSRQTVKYTDRSKMRIHNDGTGTLVITKLTTTNTRNFTLTGVSIGSGGLSVAPGRYVDVTINFKTTGAEARTLHTEKLVMQSNADNASKVSATFRGAYMRYIEGGNEIDAQQVMDAFGFKTTMGAQKRPSSDYPTDREINSGSQGDVILSKLFVQADKSTPVRMIQLAAFHSPGEAPTALRTADKSKIVGDMRYSHGGLYHQTLLPKLTNTSSEQAGDYTSSTGEAFQILIAGYATTGGGYQGVNPSKLLGVRIYRAVDANGRNIPNEYIVLQDYIGSGCGGGSHNCDWNDNVAYITNVRPQGVPAAKAIPDLSVSPQVVKVYPTDVYFTNGYPGNKLTYSAALSSGGSLPSWIKMDAATGRLTVTAPSSVSGRSYGIKVTVTDYNNLKASGTFTLKVGGTVTEPTEPSEPTEPAPAPPTTGGDSEFWLEAECAQFGSKWSKERDAAASHSGYVVVKSGNSTGAPPPDNSDNRVRFILSDVKSGSYQLFARIRAQTANDDSFWVRINSGAWYRWYNGIVEGTGFTWNQLPGNAFNLKTGTNTIDFAYREDGAQLDKIFITGKGTKPSGLGPTATNCGVTQTADNFWLEAECGSVGSGWKTYSSSSASSGKYVTFVGDRRTSVPTSNEPAQQVTFRATLADAGTYHLFLRLNAPDPGRNSVWVRIDEGKWIKMWEDIGGSQILTRGFEWRKVNNDGTDVSFNLSKGDHIIRIANREPGTQIDKVYLSSSKSLPSGTGSAASNCGATSSAALTAAQRPTPDQQLSADPEIALFPNPARDVLTVQLDSDYDGPVSLRVFDLTGRPVIRQVVEKAGGQLTTQLELAPLVPGTYRLELIEGDRRTIRPFVKIR